jgi:hypothetical protein
MLVLMLNIYVQFVIYMIRFEPELDSVNYWVQVDDLGRLPSPNHGKSNASKRWPLFQSMYPYLVARTQGIFHWDDNSQMLSEGAFSNRPVVFHLSSDGWFMGGYFQEYDNYSMLCADRQSGHRFKWCISCCFKDVRTILCCATSCKPGHHHSTRLLRR